jgi:hypothetical protein
MSTEPANQDLRLRSLGLVHENQAPAGRDARILREVLDGRAARQGFCDTRRDFSSASLVDVPRHGKYEIFRCEQATVQGAHAVGSQLGHALQRARRRTRVGVTLEELAAEPAAHEAPIVVQGLDQRCLGLTPQTTELVEIEARLAEHVDQQIDERIE